MTTNRDISGNASGKGNRRGGGDVVGGLDIRPLTARSLLASMLLGTYPPRLPVRVLVAAAGLFGITEGSARTALSRMVAAGDVTSADGWYELGPSLISRQQRQDVGRRAERLEWDGSWRTLIVTAERRQAADRTAARSVLLDERFAELREGVWARPANLTHGQALQELTADGWVVGRMMLDAPVDVSALWPIEAWFQAGVELDAELEALTPGFEQGDRTMLARGFILAAATLRHFRADPLLPDALIPEVVGQKQIDVRARYDRFDEAYRNVLRDFFDETRPSASSR